MFILNPNASGFKNYNYEFEIDRYLKKIKPNFEYDIRISKKPKETLDIAINAAKEGYNELIAVGGDGTINEVANVVVGNKLKLGIIPAGTGNDYMKSLNEDTDFHICMDRIIRGNSKFVDYGNFMNLSFFNVISVGFDAEINNIATSIKRYIKSQLSYKIAIVLGFFKHKRKRYKLIIDNKEYEDDFFLIAVGIGNKYGGGINILPNAKIDDGFLDICAIKFKSKLDILKKFKSILNASHINLDITLYERAKKVNILSKNLDVNYDGEYLNNINEVEFSISENKIEIIM